MDKAQDSILFLNRETFHSWLISHHEKHPGIWIKFDKTHKESVLTPEQALDEALCFGWIDGQIKSLGDQFYLKYFAKRSPKSVWSTKNKKSIERLTKDGQMKPSGIFAVELAKKDGRWERADLDPIDFSVKDFIQLLSHNEKARTNFLAMSNSIQKTYAMSYYALKKPESRDRRLLVIFERLENNLKPM